MDTGPRRVTLGAVDDHPVLLAGLRAELSRLDPSIDFVSEAPTVASLVATGSKCDVVLLDLRLRDQSRPATNVGRLLERGSRVLVYTEGGARALIEEALRAGAHGVLRKDRPPATLAEAIRAVADVQIFDSEELAQALDGVQVLRPVLSERERQVLTLYAAGLPTKLVARRLGVGIETTREYLKRIRTKYAALQRPAHTRMDLYQRAVEDGMVDPLASG
jgi:DNA-binding NarL/FixJ family response regulator